MGALDLADWSDAIDNMSREDLELFAIHAIGRLMMSYTDKTPQEIFEMIYRIREKEY